jgi:protein phosphatase
MSFLGFGKRTVRISVFGKTDVGRAREHNEDRFLVADLTRRIPSLAQEVREHEIGAKGTLMVVADGMGGAAAGEVASEMATDVIYDHLVSTWLAERHEGSRQFAFRLKEAIEIANAHIHGHAQRHTQLRGMGTTVTAAGVLGPAVFLAQVGDSRAYLVRKGETRQLTKDQSLTRQLVESGQISEAEAETSLRRNIILQALGPSPTVDVDLTRQQIRKGDTLVLCSDGLSGVVSPEEIGETVARSHDSSIACDDLIELANSRGGPDNITAIVARFDGSGLREPRTGDQVGHRRFRLHP